MAGAAVFILLFAGGVVFLRQYLQDSRVSDSSGQGNVIARVNGEEVYSNEVAELQEVFNQQGQEVSENEVLEQIINQKLISQEVEEKGYAVSNEEAEAVLEEQLAAQGSTLEEFKQQIEEQGVTYQEQLEYIKEQLATQNYLADVIDQESLEVSEGESKEFYEMYQDQESSEETATFEELEPQIIATLQQQKEQQEIMALIQKLKETAEIEYL